MTDGWTDETIMPDGRPLFAWENEIAMARAERGGLERDREECRSLMHLLRVLRVSQETDQRSGDLVIRVTRLDMVTARDQFEAVEKAVERASKETP